MILIRRILFVLAICLASTSIVNSIPSYPHPVRIAVEGGYQFILLKGDEHFKYAVTDDGYTLLPKGEQWFYAKYDEDGNVICSDYVLSAAKDDNGLRDFLNVTPKGIKPSFKRDSAVFRVQPMDAGGEFRAAAVGHRKALVILMQFRDKAMVKTQDDFLRLFNEENYTEDGALGSVYDFFKWASYGQLDLHSDVVGPYTTRYDMAYYGGNSGYGGNDKNPYAMFEEAVNEAIKEVDLSDYDADGDGYVDNIHIIYAGFGEEAGASANAIWAHEMTFRPITIQGMKIDRYSCAPELRGNFGNGISRIGPHCHEIGHALGAMDYYDTDYETGGYYQGTGQWDIMASGSWNNDGISPADFNPYVKVYDYGWTEALPLIADTVNNIKSSTEKGNIYRIDTGTEGDFFLLEDRNGEYFHASEPGKGLLVFHIGSQLGMKAQQNTINASYPQQCYVVCASSTYKHPSSAPNSYGNINSAGCPFPGTSNNHDFSDDTTPAAYTIDGHATGIVLSGIDWSGDDIQFLFGGGVPPVIPDSSTTEKASYWHEDFEQMTMPSAWTYSDIVGSGDFSVVMKFSDSGTSQSPSAASGRGYAKFANKSQNVFGRYRTCGVITTNYIRLESGMAYELRMKVRKYSRLQDACDTLSLSVKYADRSLLIKETEIANQDEWNVVSATIPSDANMFSIGVGCSIDSGSIMFFDDMEIVASDATMVNGSVEMPYDLIHYEIYDMSGMNSGFLRKGFNIVRIADGSYRKVLIK